MRLLRFASWWMAFVFLFPPAGLAADVTFTVPPARARSSPSAKGVTVCIEMDAVKDLRQFEVRPATPDIPSLQSPKTSKDRCVARNRSLYGQAIDNILIAGNRTVADIVADALANALSSMGFKVVRSKEQAPVDAVHAEILIDRFWGWMDVPQGRVLLDDLSSDMVGGMETRINLSRSGGRSTTVTVTGDGRAHHGLRFGAAWQNLMTFLLQSYMARAQARFAELDYSALDATAPPPPAGEKEQLRKLRALREENLITEEEYQLKRKDILDRM